MRGAIVLICVALAACSAPAGLKTPVGYFLPVTTADQQERMVDDAVRQIASTHLPARTRIVLGQPTPDSLGLSLIAALRDKGFAVQEQAGATSPVSSAASAALAAKADGETTATDVVELRYLVDALGENLYRLTLFVASQELSRAYVAQGGSVVPAGAWVRKE